MKEEDIRKVLETIPGSRRAAKGVLLDIPKKEGGGFFHITGMMRTDPDLKPEEHFFTAFCSKNEIVRLREIKSTYDYLLRVRAMAVVDNPRLVRVMRARREAFEAKGRLWSLTNYYQSQSTFHKSYIAKLSRADQKKLKGLPAGCAPIEEANATCMQTTVGQIVFVSESLEYFYYFMAIALFGESLEIPQVDQIHAAAIALRIMMGKEALDFEIDPRGELPLLAEKAVNNIVCEAMEWTFGHEFAHYLCDHNSKVAATKVQGDPQKFKVFSHNLEYEADLHAITSINGGRKASQAIASGAYFALLTLYFLEQSNLLDRFSASVSHPAPIERLNALEAALSTKIQPSEIDLDGGLKTVEALARGLSKFNDLSWYGSIYLPSYRMGKLIDRIDF